MKSMELTEADWDLFLAGAKQKRYRKGDFVLEEGQPTAALFQVQEATRDATPREEFPLGASLALRLPASALTARLCARLILVK